MVGKRSDRFGPRGAVLADRSLSTSRERPTPAPNAGGFLAAPEMPGDSHLEQVGAATLVAVHAPHLAGRTGIHPTHFRPNVDLSSVSFRLNDS